MKGSRFSEEQIVGVLKEAEEVNALRRADTRSAR
jgi:hypothetical protein